MSCPDPQARRDRAHGQSAGAQGRRRRGGDRGSGRDAGFSSEVFAGPQPDRAGFQQTQGASAQGGRAYDPAPLASDRSRRYRFQPARMRELLSPCGLRSNMTGICSSLQGDFGDWADPTKTPGASKYLGEDSFNAFSSPGPAKNEISENDLIKMDIIGYD